MKTNAFLALSLTKLPQKRRLELSRLGELSPFKTNGGFGPHQLPTGRLKMTNYIAYYRVSTDKQGRSGLGLEAQQAAVNRFLNGQEHQVFIEVESGGNRNRPELNKALAICRKTGATLVVAKLDRLARDELLILTIIESGVLVKFLDMPDIDTSTAVGRFMLNSLANVGAFEKRLISERTKAALAAAKARGQKLGSPNPHAGGQARAAQLAAVSQVDSQALIIARDLKSLGMTTTRQIAAGLSERGIKTATGSTHWHSAQVSRLLAA
jgi:DNA invertase Pin-like site-specific DNA recombinase